MAYYVAGYSITISGIVFYYDDEDGDGDYIDDDNDDGAVAGDGDATNASISLISYSFQKLVT